MLSEASRFIHCMGEQRRLLVCAVRPCDEYHFHMAYLLCNCFKLWRDYIETLTSEFIHSVEGIMYISMFSPQGRPTKIHFPQGI